MTNREKFIKTFDVQPGRICPISMESCVFECSECGYNDWWNQPFKIKRKPRSTSDKTSRAKKKKEQ